MVVSGMASAVALGREPVAPAISEPAPAVQGNGNTAGLAQIAAARQGPAQVSTAPSATPNTVPAIGNAIATPQAQENAAAVTLLSLVVAPNQTVDEGAQLSIVDVGQFSAFGPNSSTDTFTYTINWGDGKPADSGMATIDVPGTDQSSTKGSFDGQKIYADNGLYTVTVSISDEHGNSASGSFKVVVDNVAPSLTVAPDQTVNEGTQLSITNIGQFTDPGFNNPLNVGGETSEKFAYAINWGDGTPVDSGRLRSTCLARPGCRLRDHSMFNIRTPTMASIPSR